MSRGLPLVLLALLVAPAGARAQRTEMVAMGDGVRLATDVYLPAAPGAYPVILMRTPYDKSAQRELGTMIAAAGQAALVVQDLRGRFASEGVDCVFRCDGEDGPATMAWIAAQPWSAGPIVTYGGSALGIVQYMAAPGAPGELAAMWVDVGTSMAYDDAFFPGGQFRQDMIERWLGLQGSAFFLDEVRAHPLRDSFWDPVQTARRYAEVDVPAVHRGGWFDIFAQGTIDAYVGYERSGGPGARGRQLLIMGPWTHGGVGGVDQGELTFPDVARQPPLGDDLLLRFLLHHLGVMRDDAWADALPAVAYYVMGDVDDPGAPGNEWRTAESWPPPAAAVRFHLGPAGTLTEQCPTLERSHTEYVYDPADPTPTLGGPELLLPAGPHDQRPIEARDDVIVFETEPLGAPMEVTGFVRAHLLLSIDRTDSDVVVRLTDVYPDGRSMLMLDGITRIAARESRDRLAPVAPLDTVAVDVDLYSTSIVFAAGHRVRISIASANAPRFRASPNDGTSYGEPSTPVPVTVRVSHGLGQASYIELPDPTRDPSTVTRCDGPPPADGGVPIDAGPGTDAGGGGGGGGGCGCRTTTGEGAAWLALLVLVGLVRARGRSRGRASPG